jgi:hypothetical protein
MRQVVRASSDLRTYYPQDSAQWDAAYARFQSMIGS